MPVQALSELVVYSGLLTELARSRYRQEHPERVRLPAHFDERLDMRLVRIDEGSAVSVLERPASETTLVRLDDEFDWARDVIIDLVDLASRETSPAAILEECPEAARPVLPLFNRLGQGLKPTESMNFVGNGRTSAKYTTATRARLVRAGGSDPTVLGELTGYVANLDSRRQRFSIITESRTVDSEYKAAQFALLHGAMRDPPADGVAVQVRGELTLDAKNQPLRVESLVDVTTVGSYDWALARLEDLAEVDEPEWFADGVGSVDERALTRVREFIAKLEAQGVEPAPYLYPTDAGGVRAEWSHETAETSVDIHPDGRTVLHTWDSATDDDRYEDRGSWDCARLVATVIESGAVSSIV